MTVARMFELITDCLVCMGSFFLGLVSVLVFSGVFMFMPVHVRKRGDPLKPATATQFFLIASRRAVKNPLAVLEFAASSSSHDDAYPRAKKTMPDAGELKESRVVGA